MKAASNKNPVAIFVAILLSLMYNRTWIYEFVNECIKLRKPLKIKENPRNH